MAPRSMMYRRVTIAAALCAAGFAATRLAQQSQHIPRSVVPAAAIPDTETWAGGSEIDAFFTTTASSGAEVEVEVAVSTLERSVRLLWGTALDLNVTASEEPDADAQAFAVGFFPMGACSLEGRRVLVAGAKGDLGVIELWSFDPPRHAPGALKAGGRYQVDQVPYLDAGSYKSYSGIRCMWSNENAGPDEFLAFDSKTHTLLSINASSGMTSPVATASSIVGNLAATPEMADEWPYHWGPLEHETRGTHYFLSKEGEFEHFPTADPYTAYILMEDSDKDGAIDAIYPMTLAEFAADGLDDPSVYD